MHADPPWFRFDAPGGAAWALPGVHAAGKLDPGSALLLRELAAHGTVAEGAAVLDLGCGWGPLARHAADRGARVTAVDDDLAAARRRVAPGGEIWLVANAALPYEAAFPAGDEVAEMVRERGFKVLRVRPRSGR